VHLGPTVPPDLEVWGSQVSISVFPQGRSRLYSLPLTPLGGSISVDLSILGHVELCNLPHIHALVKKWLTFQSAMKQT
jgi:hypothetical protein